MTAGLQWLWPWVFLLAPLPLLLRWLWRPLTRQEAALRVPSVARFQGAEPARLVRGRQPVNLRVALLWLLWLALLTAAARPQWTGEPVSLPTSGRDLMLAVDISGSMGTEDMELRGALVNRLTVVKQVVGDFMATRQGDRLGLILFGTNAYLQAPLTFDLTSVQRLLAEAPVGIAGGKTAIGDAIGLAVKRLRARPAGDRVLILLTDGASNVGEVTPVKAAELAASEGIRVYTIGVGATELRMPSIFGSFGARVVNPSADLDEETLQRIAGATGGRYFRAENTAELAEVYALIDDLEPIEQDAETFRPIAALYHWPLALAWVACCLLVLCHWRGWGEGSAGELAGV